MVSACGVAWLATTGLPWDDDLPPVAHARATRPDAPATLAQQIARGINSPPTSSMGRLFDAAAALAGVRQTVTYEAQAAIEFEAACDGEETAAYPFDYANDLIDPAPLWAALLADRRAGLPLPRLAARFHNGVAHMTRDVCRRLRAAHGLDAIVLSGGVWQNMTLLRATLALLAADGFTVYTHRLVPPNDGGLALGQAAVATAIRMKDEG
ncbi:MAG: hypothetical protein K1X50_16350 [Candidatus Promineofilum sp.]|mgnify:FL=1|nr:hypothetical protein [Promineifilum sp.]